jgi:integrase
MPLLSRNPFTPLGLIRPEPEECRWLEFTAAELLLKHLDPWYVLLVTFLLATGIRWGEAAALQVKDVHLGDGTEADPPWVYVHKTWKRVGKCGDRKKESGRKPRKGAKYLWGRGRTKTVAGRRRITLTQGLRSELLPLLAGRDPQDPVFTGKGDGTGKDGGILHNSNFTERYLKPALEKARDDLAVLRAAATTAKELAALPLEIPEIRPHAFRHTHVITPAVAARGTAKSGIRRLVPHKVSDAPEARVAEPRPGTFFFAAVFWPYVPYLPHTQKPVATRAFS